MKIVQKMLLALLLPAFLIACPSDDAKDGDLIGYMLAPAAVTAAVVTAGAPRIISMRIEHYMAPCTGVFVQMCYMVQEEGAASPHFLYGGIEGFEYEWGFVYLLRIKVEAVPNPPADASATKLTLVEMQSKEAAATDVTFTVTLSKEYVTGDAPSGYKMAGVTFVCATTALENALDAKLATDERFEAQFKHPTNAEASLTLIALP